MSRKKTDEATPKPRRRRKAASSKTTPTAIEPPQAPGVFRDEGLLESARTKWQYAEWQDMTALDPETIARDPDRAKLSLLVAAAHSHAGEMGQAKRFARQALSWGCTRELAARVLVSAVHNSLGRVAACLEDDETETAHFEDAIRLVEPRADATLLGRTRRIREIARLGLLTDATGLLQKELDLATRDPVSYAPRLVALKSELALIRHGLTLESHRAGQDQAAALPAPSKPTPDKPDDATIGNPLFNLNAFKFYTTSPEREQAPVVYIDSKSLPRSGLHYLRNSLHEILGSGFSFCEWYLEPGCCRQMPCTLCPPPGPTSHFRARLVKSHDFDLNDPVFPADGQLRRMVLLRDPLFILTSWWALQTIQQHAKLLKTHGIETQKINYLHEKPLVARAYAIIDQHGTLAGPNVLKSFLAENSEYIVSFVEKWSKQEAQIVPYARVPHTVCDLLGEYEDSLTPDAQERLERFRERLDADFTPRSSPFEGPSPSLTGYLQDNAELFRKAAATILEQDKSGLLMQA